MSVFLTPPPPPEAPSPDITVVVPVRNEGPYIEALLDDLRQQDLAGASLEILVVDGMSTDDTRERVRRRAIADPRIHLLDNARRLSSAARALGTQHARGRYVAVVDGHCRVPSRRLLQDMVGLFERTGADCLARPQPLAPTAGGAWARAIAAGRTSRFGHSVASTIYDEHEHAVPPTSAGAMYRREVFERVGTFDPAFDACEDVEFNWRCAAAGLSCWTSPALAVLYEPRRSLGGLFRQMRRYGLGRARLHRKHPGAFTLESLVPALFAAGLVPAVLGALLLPLPWRAAAAAPLTLYLLLDVVASLVTAARHGLLLFPLLLLVFPTIHLGLGLGYLQGRLTRAPAFAAAASAGARPS
jgi:succinoglycan biosynthesis protein ExoA